MARRKDNTVWIRVLKEHKTTVPENLRKSPARLNVQVTYTEHDLRQWKTDKLRELVKNTLEKGVHLNPEYAPYEGKEKFDVVFSDRTNQTEVVWKGDVELPDIYEESGQLKASE